MICQSMVWCRVRSGTAVEQLAPDVFEVEFADLTGRAYAMMALKADDVMILHHDRMLQAA
jgi:hypothetical protein